MNGKNNRGKQEKKKRRKEQAQEERTIKLCFVQRKGRTLKGEGKDWKKWQNYQTINSSISSKFCQVGAAKTRSIDWERLQAYGLKGKLRKGKKDKG